jgi:L-asparagine transporter-like permease
MILNSAAAGIPSIKYNMSILGVLRIARSPGRGDATYSTWKLKEAHPSAPLTRRPCGRGRGLGADYVFSRARGAGSRRIQDPNCLPAAAHLVNFVVITAAASSMNCNLYLCSRTMFSLARGGYAPRFLGEVSSRGAPLPALLVSAAGLGLATWLAFAYPDGAFIYLFGIALFGGLFVWLMIFVTHLFFRSKWDSECRPRLPVRMIGYPYTSLVGAAAIVAILGTTWWVEGMRVTLIAGLPWLGVVTVAYFLVRRRR